MIFPISLKAFGDPKINFVRRGVECAGEEKGIGMVPTLMECANGCEGESSMFLYGFGPKCSADGCWCVCETGAEDGRCTFINIEYNLYNYLSPCKYLLHN